MYYLFSGIAGAIVAITIAALARSNFYILAGLAPLFPTFALFAHILSYKAGGIAQVREVALFGACSIIPYLAYVLSLYLFAERLRFEYALASSLILWFISAGILYFVWSRA